MALHDILSMYVRTTGVPWTLLLFVLVAWIVIRCIFRIFFHPLRHIPGPLRTKCSSLWLNYHMYIGDLATATHRLHSIYGPMVRVAPNDIDVATADALGPIYVDHGGFEKSDHYSKFNLIDHSTIFSTLSVAARSSRAKAVLPIFSANSTREATETISGFANHLVRRMGMEAKTGRRVDILSLLRAFAFDVVSSQLMQKPYGGLEESSPLLSAYPFIDSISQLGSLFFLSHSLYAVIEWLLISIPGNIETKSSFKTMEVYLKSVVNQAKAGGSSYPSRLLAQGMGADEVAVECGDVLYAGTDATAQVLATICWNLVAHPEQYALLREELKKSSTAGLTLQTLPYLGGVVKEGMRIAMPNACRLSRVVPPQGWNFEGYFIPAKTTVGVNPFELHSDQTVYPQPEKFLPERWLNTTSEMNASFMPFSKGSRSCIARNLATAEIFIATEAIVRADVLRGAKVVKDKIEIYEWFNCKVKDGAIELIWSGQAS